MGRAKARKTIDVEKAFVVMGTTEKDGESRVRQLSRRYHVGSAADECCRMWRKNGVLDAFVKTVIGREHKIPEPLM